MAKKTKAEGQPEVEYGKTGYGITLAEEGKAEVEGNFITDEDLKEFNDLKAAKQTGQFITNEDAAEMKSLQEENHNLKKQIDFVNERMSEVDKQYSLLKEKQDAGLLLTNDEAGHYQHLKEKANQETAELEAKELEAVKAADALKQAAINKLGPNPVEATNEDGRKTFFTRQAWDGLAWIEKDGQPTDVKQGGWKVKAEIPPVVAEMRGNG